jgi:photosystem II stability/assembly factor-like uncharacterized protein
VSACSSADGQYFAAVASVSQKVYYSSDKGANWIPFASSTDQTYSSVAANADFTKLFTTSVGTGIYKSSNGGLNWSFVINTSYATCICSNSTGERIAVGTNRSGIYTSNDSGDLFQQKSIPNVVFRSICSDSTGRYLAACGDSSFIYTSDYFGDNWVSRASLLNWKSICCDSTGKYLYAVATNQGIYASYDYGVTWSVSYSVNISWTSVSSNSSGLRLAAVASGNNNLYLGSLNIQYPCFKEDSLILTNKGYRRIQELRKGDLVKTLLNGFLKIDMIGKKEIVHKACVEDRIKDQLYKCSHENFEEVFEPLVLTGCHSILVDEFVSEEQKQKAIEINENRLCVTDRKYRLPACVDERTTVYEIPGTYTIYHLALENPDYYMNYGIYANGLLVETCSRRYLKELSGMELIE